MQLNRSYIASIDKHGVMAVILYDGLASPIHHFIKYYYDEFDIKRNNIKGEIWLDITDLQEVIAVYPLKDPILFNRLNEMLVEYKEANPK